MGFLAKLKKDKIATFYDFSHSKILEITYKHSSERLAIPDWVDNKQVFWLIKEAILELRGTSTTIPNAYAWISLRLKNAFTKLWGYKTITHNFQEWDKTAATIIVDWSDFTVEDMANGQKVTFRAT